VHNHTANGILALCTARTKPLIKSKLRRTAYCNTNAHLFCQTIRRLLALHEGPRLHMSCGEHRKDQCVASDVLRIRLL